MEPAQRLLYWTNRRGRLLWPGGFLRREVEDGPRDGAEGRGWNVRRFGQLSGRVGTLADWLAVAGVGRREAAPAIAREHLTVARLELFPPAPLFLPLFLSLFLPSPRVPGYLRSARLLCSSVFAATAAPAAAIAGLHLSVVRVRVRRPGGRT